MSLTVVAAVLAVGCAKKGNDPAGDGVWNADQGPRPPLDGFTRVEPPAGYGELRVLSSVAWRDGSIALSGGAIKVAQYQWVLRAPAVGEPAHGVYDPGRIEGIRDDGTQGMDAVGVLGGIPEDKAWYGDIDAFGNVHAKQTYLSDGAGQLRSVVRLGDGLATAGTMTGTDGVAHGWIVRTDANGRDLWKKELGDATDQGLAWIGDGNGVLVAAGWKSGAPWVVAVDANADVVLDKRYDVSTPTKLGSGAILTGGDLVVVGLQAADDLAALNGLGTLWTARVGPDGTSAWDRADRSDLSAVSRGVRWGNGVAVAALVGSAGAARTVAVAYIRDDGTITWSAPPLPAGVGFAEVHAVAGQLVLVAAVSDPWGVSWRRMVLEGAEAP